MKHPAILLLLALACTAGCLGTAADPPAGTTVRPMPTAAITPLFLSSIENARRSGVDMPSYLPEGYAFNGGVHLPGGYTVLRFMDGMGNLEVTERLYDPYREDGVLPGTPEPVILAGGREAEYVSAGGGRIRFAGTPGNTYT